MKICVLGGGSWGTTLANIFAHNGSDVTLWIREPVLYADVVATRINKWFLPDIRLHPALAIENDLRTAMAGKELFLLVIPCQFTREVLLRAREFFPRKPVVVCASKGIETDTLLPLSEVVAQALEGLSPVYAMLSGPSFAKEVSRFQPTAVTLGCADRKLAPKIQAELSTDAFRVYTSSDCKAVELGGALKNVVAIASGISDGLGFGTNARAALITRGLSEMARLGKAMGGKEKTFMGLSGMGDLVLTCTGDLSRNRQVGLRLAAGEKLLDILNGMKMVAEGVKTTEAVHALGGKLGVDLPITRQVFEILFEEKDPRQAVGELMGRSLKNEMA